MTRIGMMFGWGCCLVSISALAQPNPEVIKAEADAYAISNPHSLGGDLNVGMLDGDLFTTINLSLKRYCHSFIIKTMTRKTYLAVRDDIWVGNLS